MQAWYAFAPGSSVDLKLYCCYSATLITKNMYIVKILVFPSYFLRESDTVPFNLHFKVQLSLAPVISSHLCPNTLFFTFMDVEPHISKLLLAFEVRVMF